jgi:hypothetical protein
VRGGDNNCENADEEDCGLDDDDDDDDEDDEYNDGTVCGCAVRGRKIDFGALTLT